MPSHWDSNATAKTQPTSIALVVCLNFYYVAGDSVGISVLALLFQLAA